MKFIKTFLEDSTILSPSPKLLVKSPQNKVKSGKEAPIPQAHIDPTNIRTQSYVVANLKS